MNVWRWFGLSLFLIGVVTLLGTTKFPSFASAQDKKSTSTATKTDDKKSTTAEKAKETPKKTEEPKKSTEPSKETPPSGAKLQFKAFDKGAKFYQVQKTVTKQEMTVMNQPIKQNQEQTFVIEWVGGDKKGMTMSSPRRSRASRWRSSSAATRLPTAPARKSRRTR